MILENSIDIQLNGVSVKYWLDKGYTLPIHIDSQGREKHFKRGTATLKVKVSDLQPKSNVIITAICMTCCAVRTLPYHKYTPICWACNLNKQKGMKHPRWLHRVKTGGAERAFDLYLRRTYGITSKLYYKILSIQKHKCAICKKHQSIDGRRFAVDHLTKSNGSKLIRGILCQSCNTALGLLQENSKIVSAAYKYMTKGKYYE